MEDKIKCATWDQSGISPETRRKMNADRAFAEAKEDGCRCLPSMQSYACPAYDKKTCIHHPDVVKRLK